MSDEKALGVGLNEKPPVSSSHMSNTSGPPADDKSENSSVRPTSHRGEDPEKDGDFIKPGPDSPANGAPPIGIQNDVKPEERDPNVVDWDGPDDPTRAMNWPARMKWNNIAIISAITFLTPLASSMFAPGVQEVMDEFNSTNEELASFVVSIYVMGFAIGPLIIAPLSELYGRLPVYHVCNTLFVIFTVACAVSSNISMLTVFRFFEGCAGSAPLTIGGGSLADMVPQEKRGGVMAIWVLGPILGPVIGPVAGGFLTEAKGWRWVFWVIAIAAGFVLLCSAPILRETYPPILLQRKTNRLIKETGNENLKSAMDTGLPPRELFLRSIIRPSKMLIFSPIVLLLSVYMGLTYGYLYLLFTTITPVFQDQYHFSQGTVGLTYLGIGLGSLFGVIGFGIASDRVLKHMAKDGELKPEYRLPPLYAGAFLIPIGLFWYGWSAQAKIQWIMPIIGTMWVGLGLLAIFLPINSYLVDAFTLHAASALAASTVIRSLMGALLPLAGRSMYEALDLGWGNSLLAFIALIFVPIPLLLMRYGERIRKSPRFQIQF